MTARRPTSVHESMEGSACRVTVRGDLDRLGVRSLLAHVRYAEQRGSRSLIIDLADCGFIDPAGVSVLIDAARRARGNGREFAVADPPPSGKRRPLQPQVRPSVLRV